MNKKPLETLFGAMYHGKLDFKDFVEGNIESKYQTKTIENRERNKKRVVHVPNSTLKSFHEFLTLFLFEYLAINEGIVFSYRKGVNVGNAVALHAKGRHFFQADLHDFFPSITTDIVRRTILLSAEHCPIIDLEKYLNRIIDLVTIDGSLPLGFSTSPIISNAALKPFDDLFEKYCTEHRLTYTRYSDDIIVSGAERQQIEGLAEIVEKIFIDAKIGKMRLNETKVKFTSIGRKIKILGMVILPNGTISVDTKLKNYVETLLYLYIKDKLSFRNFIQRDATKSEEKLSGYLNYINTVDQHYLDKLRRKYGVTVIDTLIHQSKK